MGTQGRYVPAIDGLRAVAVLAVVAYHAGLPVPGGFVGVDVFFVISGYLITRLLRNELDATGRIDYRGFYVRRIRRIYPALVLVIASTTALSGLLSHEAREALLRSALASLAMVGNVHFQTVTGGYFDVSSDSMPLLHLWSLGVEEQFYLAWPIVLAFVVRGRLGFIVGLAAGSLLLAEWLLTTSPEAAFYQMPARWWELAVGAGLAMRPLPTQPGPWPSVAGAVLLVAALFIPPARFPGLGAAPAVIGAALIIWGLQSDSPVRRMLASPPMVAVGLISYSFYLWHWPLLAIHRAITPETSLATAVALSVAAAGLAQLTYQYIETPLRRPAAAGRLGAAGCLCAIAIAAAAAPVPAPIRPTEMADPYAIEQPEYKCLVPEGRNRPPADGCREPSARVILWGDSHASAWRAFADSYGHVADFTKSSCFPAPGAQLERPGLPAHGPACAQHNAAALARAMQGADTLVIAAYYLDREFAIRHMADAIDAVAPGIGRIMLLMPTPYLDRPASECLRLSLRCGMDRRSYDAYADPIRLELDSIAQRHANVHVVDIADFFCTSSHCPVVLHGTALYSDAHHVTPEAARRFTSQWHEPHKQPPSSHELGAKNPAGGA